MAMLPSFLDVKDDRPRLVHELEAALGPRDEVEILFAGEGALRLVGIEGQAIEIFLAFGGARMRVPLTEGPRQVARDGAAHVGHFDALVVEGIEQVGGKLLAPASLVAFQDQRSLATR